MVSTKLFSVFAAICIIATGQIKAQEVICPTPDALIPHHDCRFYYHCSNFVPNLVECPGELYFNPAIGGCDYPENVPECVGGTNKPPPTGPTEEPITDWPTTSVPETEAPSTVRPTDAPTDVPSTVAPTDDPSTAAPTVEPTTAAPTQEPSTAVPSEAPSTSAPTQEPTTNVPTEVPTEAPTTAEPTELPPVTTQEPPEPTQAPFCPPTGVHDFPFPGNCSLYIRCIQGTEHILECAKDLLFDSVDRICKPAIDAVCYEEDKPSSTEAPPEFECPIEGYHTFPHKSSCSMYYLCYNGQLFIEECALGTYYDEDPAQNRCNLAEFAICHSECPASGIRYLPIRTNTCRYYKICFDGDSINMSCAENTIYSPNQEKCVSLDAYTCPYSDHPFQ